MGFWKRGHLSPQSIIISPWLDEEKTPNAKTPFDFSPALAGESFQHIIF
jgi:hypothetical protein